jgi:hypothetical protein
MLRLINRHPCAPPYLRPVPSILLRQLLCNSSKNIQAACKIQGLSVSSSNRLQHQATSAPATVTAEQEPTVAWASTVRKLWKHNSHGAQHQWLGCLRQLTDLADTEPYQASVALSSVMAHSPHSKAGVTVLKQLIDTFQYAGRL